MLITDLVDIKHNNLKEIVSSVRFEDGLTKKDIAQKTALSFATVSNLSNDLVKANILDGSRVANSRVGRTPNLLSLRYDSFFHIALDFQIENSLGLAIIDLRNTILFQDSYDTSMLSDAQAVVEYAKKLVDRILSDLDLSWTSVLKVGAAVPAIFDSVDGRLKTSAISMFENTPLKQMLLETFNLNAYVDNVSNFCAMSVHSRFRTTKNIVCLDISQGVGVGVVSEGHLIRGKNGYASEIAHVPIGTPTLKCLSCGCYGCVETDLSLDGMISNFPEIAPNLPLPERWIRFVTEMKSGSNRSIVVGKNIGTMVGKLATILINLFDPEIFSINGYITDIADLFMPYVYEQIQSRCHLSVQRGLQIEVMANTFQNIFIGIGDALYSQWYPLLD